MPSSQSLRWNNSPHVPLESWSEFALGEQSLANPELGTSLVHDESLLHPSVDFRSAPTPCQGPVQVYFQIQKHRNTESGQHSGAKVMTRSPHFCCQETCRHPAPGLVLSPRTEPTATPGIPPTRVMLGIMMCKTKAHHSARHVPPAS